MDCLVCHMFRVDFQYSVTLCACVLRTRRVTVRRRRMHRRDLEMMRTAVSWGKWSCSVLCAWSGLRRTRSASTRRTFVSWHRWTGISRVCTYAVRLFFPAELACRSWPIMCFTAMCVTTAETRTSWGNKQVSGSVWRAELVNSFACCCWKFCSMY